MYFLIFFTLARLVSSANLGDLTLTTLYCESFKEQAIYKTLNLGDDGTCETFVIPTSDSLCLSSPTNPEQVLRFTCKTIDEVYFG